MNIVTTNSGLHRLLMFAVLVGERVHGYLVLREYKQYGPKDRPLTLWQASACFRFRVTRWLSGQGIMSSRTIKR